jgi:hypothetical protein
MSGDALPAAPPMKPQELDQALALDAPSRAEWMLEQLARYEQAWGLVNAEGWVVFELAQAPPGLKPWALPLWPRQELAALASRGEGEAPQAVPLDELLGGLLPLVAERGWQLLACPAPDGQGLVREPLAWAAQVQEGWDEYQDDEA